MGLQFIRARRVRHRVVAGGRTGQLQRCVLAGGEASGGPAGLRRSRRMSWVRSSAPASSASISRRGCPAAPHSRAMGWLLLPSARRGRQARARFHALRPAGGSESGRASRLCRQRSVTYTCRSGRTCSRTGSLCLGQGGGKDCLPVQNRDGPADVEKGDVRHIGILRCRNGCTLGSRKRCRCRWRRHRRRAYR